MDTHRVWSKGSLQCLSISMLLTYFPQLSAHMRCSLHANMFVEVLWPSQPNANMLNTTSNRIEYTIIIVQIQRENITFFGSYTYIWLVNDCVMFYIFSIKARKADSVSCQWSWITKLHVNLTVPFEIVTDNILLFFGCFYFFFFFFFHFFWANKAWYSNLKP